MDHLNLLLCDELLLQILLRLPSNSASISLAYKRSLALHRSSKTNLSPRIPPSLSASSSSSYNLSTILSHYPSLLSHTLLQDQNASSAYPTLQPDSLLLSITAHCHNLRHLRFLLGPFSPSSLTSLSASCRFLTSLYIHSSLQSLFSAPTWLFSFPHLKDLSVYDVTNCRWIVFAWPELGLVIAAWGGCGAAAPTSPSSSSASARALATALRSPPSSVASTGCGSSASAPAAPSPTTSSSPSFKTAPPSPRSASTTAAAAPPSNSSSPAARPTSAARPR